MHSYIRRYYVAFRCESIRNFILYSVFLYARLNCFDFIVFVCNVVVFVRRKYICERWFYSLKILFINSKDLFSRLLKKGVRSMYLIFRNVCTHYSNKMHKYLFKFYFRNAFIFNSCVLTFIFICRIMSAERKIK